MQRFDISTLIDRKLYDLFNSDRLKRQLESGIYHLSISIDLKTAYQLCRLNLLESKIDIFRAKYACCAIVRIGNLDHQDWISPVVSAYDINSKQMEFIEIDDLIVSDIFSVKS